MFREPEKELEPVPAIVRLEPVPVVVIVPELVRLVTERPPRMEEPEMLRLPPVKELVTVRDLERLRLPVKELLLAPETRS